jgi:putative flippase GtrA
MKAKIRKLKPVDGWGGVARYDGSVIGSEVGVPRAVPKRVRRNGLAFMEKAAVNSAGAALHERLQIVTGKVLPERPATLRSPGASPNLRERGVQFGKFCLVGGSGVFVDMAVLYVLADAKTLALNLTFSKICAAETALVNNFLWNEVWTFKAPAGSSSPRRTVIGRLLLFNAICGAGIFLAILLLHLFHTLLGWNLYLSNLLAIGLVTLWNFALNARFNWDRAAVAESRSLITPMNVEAGADAIRAGDPESPGTHGQNS